MNTLNKLLSRWDYQISKTDSAPAELEPQSDYKWLQAELDELRVQNKELKRKLVNKTASEWYWRKQAKQARG